MNRICVAIVTFLSLSPALAMVHLNPVSLKEIARADEASMHHDPASR